MAELCIMNKDAKGLATKINQINQIMKLMRHDSSYTIYNGFCYASPNGVNKVDKKGNSEKVDIGHTYAKLNIELFGLSNYILYIHSGKELYQFMKNFKSQITKIDICDNINNSGNYLSIYAGDSVFLIKILNSFNKDILTYNRIMDVVSLETTYPKYSGIYTLSPDEIWTLLKDKSIPTTISSGGYKIRTTKKMLQGITTKDEIEVHSYKLKDPVYFIAIFSIYKKEMTVYHMYKCINY